MKTWTTTRWELEHWIVQGGIEPLRTKSHQAQIFLIKLSYLIFLSSEKFKIQQQGIDHKEAQGYQL